MDLTKLSDADLMALQSGDLSKVSDAGLAMLSGGSSVAPVQQPAQPKEFGMLDGVSKFLQSAKQGQTNLGAGLVRGAGSIGATLLTPVDAAARAMGIQNDFIGRTDRREAMDAALRGMGAETDSLGYQGGKLVSEIAGTAGAGGVLAKGVTMLPGAASRAAPLVQSLRTGGLSAGGQTGASGLALRTGAGAATGGAAAGLVNPEDAGLGAVIGGAIPGGAKLAGETGRRVGAAFRPSPEMAGLAQKAQGYGIPLGVGDLSNSRFVQATRSILRDAPFSGGMAQGAQEAKQEAFNKAVGSTFGAPETKLTLSVLDSAKQRMGSEFDRIWNNNALQVDPQLLQKMGEIDTIAQKLPANEGASLQKEIQDIYSRMVPDANGNLQIPGDVANKFQQYLRRRAEGSAGLRNELGDLRQAMIQSFNRSVSPADAAALTMNRTQYKAFKTVEPTLRSAELGIAGRSAGDVPAALLPGAVNKSYSNLDSELADLAQIGSRFLVDRTPQTGGSARAALQNTGIGAALTLTGGVPALAAGIPSVMGLQKLMQSPKVASALMASNPQSNQKLIEALRAAQLSAPVIAAQ
jgi:hypothetical protein